MALFLLPLGGLGIALADGDQFLSISRGYVTPDTDETGDITVKPNQFNDATASWVVVYNIKEGDQKVAPTAHARNYLSRLWGGKEDSASYTANLKQCLSFIALYDYKQSSFNGGVMDGTFQ